MSASEISPIVRRMARPKKFVEEMVARFMAGTFARITAVLRPGEDRADLVREAVEREIKRRAKDSMKSSKNPVETDPGVVPELVAEVERLRGVLAEVHDVLTAGTMETMARHEVLTRRVGEALRHGR